MLIQVAVENALQLGQDFRFFFQRDQRLQFLPGLFRVQLSALALDDTRHITQS